MTDTATVLTTVTGPVATVTLSRPEALNAITPAMLDELAATPAGRGRRRRRASRRPDR